MTKSSSKIRDYSVELALYKAACEAASKACAKKIADNPGVWYPCGFAWVTIKPARGRFIDMLKSLPGETGRVSDAGGWMIWNPSGHPTQWMDAKIAGAHAFAEVLTDAGLHCDVDSRID